MWLSPLVVLDLSLKHQGTIYNCFPSEVPLRPPELRHREDNYLGTRTQCPSSPILDFASVIFLPGVSFLSLSHHPYCYFVSWSIVSPISLDSSTLTFCVRVVWGSHAIFNSDRCMLGQGWLSLPVLCLVFLTPDQHFTRGDTLLNWVPVTANFTTPGTN